jgi:hypothetical protein
METIQPVHALIERTIVSITTAGVGSRNTLDIRTHGSTS